MEIEIKLGPVEPALAAVIFDDITLLPSAGAEERIRMHTTYYDDPAGSFRAKKQTLRLRQENDLSVCTFKTALEGLARLELDCEAPDIISGAAQLAAHPDLPESAKNALLSGVFVPRCGAKFLRRTRLCRVGETTFHLCLDEGQLVNGEHAQPLCEIELELAEGDAAVLEQTAQRLMDAYHLPLCTKSKQQRALELDEVTV